MRFIVSPQDPSVPCVIIKYLYGVRWIGTDSILLSERRPHAARFYGASRCLEVLEKRTSASGAKLDLVLSPGGWCTSD
jgi:hypothetical protein